MNRSTLASLQLIEHLPAQIIAMGYGDVHIKYDSATELLAIISIHNDKFGPTIGGCRCIEYPTFADALNDTLKLARSMSYKTAICNLAWGGGKAVLLKPKHIKDRTAYYAAFGRFVNTLGGRYITSIDSGTLLSDLDAIATQTAYVSGLSHHYGDSSDPSQATATGVRHGIEAAVKFRLGRHSLAGLRIAIQGVGHVGYHLCKQLAPLGVQLIVSDINQAAIEKCQREFNARVVAPADIYQVECEVFSPCALGGILNAEIIPQLKAKIVAGSANNQCAEPGCGELLRQRGILYAPDFVTSAGGVILATALYDKRPLTAVREQLKHIYDILLSIFEQAEHLQLPPHQIAEQLAEQRLKG